MPKTVPAFQAPGPFRADQIRPGDPYELSGRVCGFGPGRGRTQCPDCRPAGRWDTRALGRAAGRSPRVEIHTPGLPLRVCRPGELLEAPGVLRNPVPVAALFDRTAAHEATLRNLLQRKGYGDLDAVREEGQVQGREEGKTQGALTALREALLLVLAQRGLDPDPARRAAVADCTDPERLRRWLGQAAVAVSLSEVFG